MTVRNVDTNLVRSEATGADGNFRFPNLPVGNYELTVELAGFGKYVRSGIKPVNGMRSRSNNFIIDGQDSNDPSVAGRTQLVNNTDIIQEVRLLTNQFAAEYGRAAGSVMSVTTKSGTNSFHGSGFVFNNNNVFNARSNLDKAAGREEAPWRIETQYGGTLGGPIFKNHTFFFGSYQRWTDRRLGSGFTLNGAPTEAGRQVLQSAVGGLPQIQALLKFLPAAQSPIGKTASFTYGGQNYVVTARPTRGSAGRSPTRTGATARSGPPTSVPSTT